MLMQPQPLPGCLSPSLDVAMFSSHSTSRAGEPVEELRRLKHSPHTHLCCQSSPGCPFLPLIISHLFFHCHVFFFLTCSVSLLAADHELPLYWKERACIFSSHYSPFISSLCFPSSESIFCHCNSSTRLETLKWCCKMKSCATRKELFGQY